MRMSRCHVYAGNPDSTDLGLLVGFGGGLQAGNKHSFCQCEGGGFRPRSRVPSLKGPSPSRPISLFIPQKT
jgi:hypothetical protein